MHIFEMFEGSGPRVIVTYPGRFQPFHLGHKDVFAALQSKFGSDNVFIVTGNKTNDTDTPFNFSDKVQFMRAAGIPAHSIIEADKVYDLPDQFQSSKQGIIFITAVGAPDAARLRPGSFKKDGTPGYFQPLPTDTSLMTTADQHGYVFVADERGESLGIGGKNYDISHGTPIRELWNSVRDNPKQRAEVLQKLYGQSDPALGEIMDKIPSGAPQPKPKPSPKLKKVKSPEITNETEVITKEQLVDIYLTGMHKGNMIKKQVGKDIPNKLVDRFIDHVSKKFNILPSAFVYGPAKKISEEAAAVGVVRDGNDPRYVMATMGDQNDVTGDTLNQMMRGYSLIGKRGSGKLKPVKDNVGKGVQESIYQYDKADPFNSEFAPDVGMGRMTLRGWKQTLARRLKDISDYALKAAESGNIDRAEMWERMHTKMKGLNLDIIAQEIELAHAELEKIRRRGGVRSRAFREKQMEVQQLEEGWKSKLAALGLAGAAALSPAPAQADAWDTIMDPVRKVQKFQRDVGNFGRNVDHQVSGVRNKVGRDLESIPIGGIDKVGRAIRGSTDHQQLQRDPAWDARVQAAKEKQARDQAEREYRMQQDAERYDTGGQETSRDRGRWGSAGVNESSAGATGAGAIATGINSTNGGFGWSIFYKQPRKKKAKIK
jgi:hypothetical protein